jgi:hypothetical protein
LFINMGSMTGTNNLTTTSNSRIHSAISTPVNSNEEASHFLIKITKRKKRIKTN